MAPVPRGCHVRRAGLAVCVGRYPGWPPVMPTPSRRDRQWLESACASRLRDPPAAYRCGDSTGWRRAASCFPFNRRRECDCGHRTRAYDSTADGAGRALAGACRAGASVARAHKKRRGAERAPSRAAAGRAALTRLDAAPTLARVLVLACGFSWHAVERETGKLAAPRTTSTCAAPATVSACIAQAMRAPLHRAPSRSGARPGHWTRDASGKAKRRCRQPGYRPEPRKRQSCASPGPGPAARGGESAGKRRGWRRGFPCSLAAAPWARRPASPSSMIVVPGRPA
ncbi:hypothetical protein DRA46_01931 [Burkholderia gladioli]|nr:hypothetical protein [Burkholderia gladioli]